MKKLNEKELEQFVHATLRSLPDRKAPGTLESRVLAAIEQRAAVAWYHKSWSYWPAAFRGLFLAVATGVGAASVAAFYLGSRGFDLATTAREAGSHFVWLTRCVGVAEWTVDFAGRMIGAIPPFWLYGGLTVVAALYVTFFGLGATAYRVLYRNK